MKGLSSWIPSLDSLLLQEQTTFLGSTVRTGLKVNAHTFWWEKKTCVSCSFLIFRHKHQESSSLPLIFTLFFYLSSVDSSSLYVVFSLVSVIHSLLSLFMTCSSSSIDCLRLVVSGSGQRAKGRSARKEASSFFSLRPLFIFMPLLKVQDSSWVVSFSFCRRRRRFSRYFEDEGNLCLDSF